MQVQVVNAATGAIVLYEARRRDIEGRVVRTLDGREIRLADVERMILTESGRGLVAELRRESEIWKAFHASGVLAGLAQPGAHGFELLFFT